MHTVISTLQMGKLRLREEKSCQEFLVWPETLPPEPCKTELWVAHTSNSNTWEASKHYMKSSKAACKQGLVWGGECL